MRVRLAKRWQRRRNLFRIGFNHEDHEGHEENILATEGTEITEKFSSKLKIKNANKKRNHGFHRLHGFLKEGKVCIAHPTRLLAPGFKTQWRAWPALHLSGLRLLNYCNKMPNGIQEY